MPDKLLTREEVAELLGISEEKVEELVKKGRLPAYQIGGRFLRFRREQVENIRKAAKAAGTPRGLPAQPAIDNFSDFFYFNDFYIISGIIIFLILWVIFKF